MSSAFIARSLYPLRSRPRRRFLRGVLALVALLWLEDGVQIEVVPLAFHDIERVDVAAELDFDATVRLHDLGFGSDGKLEHAPAVRLRAEDIHAAAEDI